MTKKSVAPVGERKAPRKIYTIERTEEQRQHLARMGALHRQFVAEALSFFATKFAPDARELGLLKFSMGVATPQSPSSEPFGGLKNLVASAVGEAAYADFLDHLTEKFEFFSEVVLEFGVSKDDLLQIALTKQFGLSAAQADDARAKIEILLSTNPSVRSESLVLPDTPPRYSYQTRMAGGIVKYLEDNWAPYISAGLMSRPDLKRVDPAAYQALNNWHGQGNKLPDELRLPTLKEMNDRALRDVDFHSLSHKEGVRLAAARTRRNRQDREPQ